MAALLSQTGAGATEQEPFWYALSVRPRHEKVVFAQLEAKQEEAFLPLYTAKHQWADRSKAVSLPLFPGYVFSRFDAQRRGNVLATSGVIDVVRFGRRPAPLDPAEIDAIRFASDRSHAVALEPYNGMVKGQPVTITEGPLSGLTGTFVEIRKSMRLALSVELLNRSVLVEVDPGWTTPLRTSDLDRASLQARANG